MSAVEIEAKAVVHDPDELFARLHRLGTLVCSYNKIDRYYGLPHEAPETRFRLRRDGDRWVCTHKEKTIRDGIEQSRETEFTLSDGDAFDRFARALGFERLFDKVKTGQRWDVSGVTVEIGTVNDLGVFAEVEILLPADAAVADREAARRRVWDVLLELGLPESAIEPRTYTEMIHENLSTGANA